MSTVQRRPKKTQIQIPEKVGAPQQLQQMVRTGTAHRIIRTSRGTLMGAALEPVTDFSAGNIRSMAHNHYSAQMQHRRCLRHRSNTGGSSLTALAVGRRRIVYGNHTHRRYTLAKLAALITPTLTDKNKHQQEREMPCRLMGWESRIPAPRLLLSTTEVGGAFRKDRFGYPFSFYVNGVWQLEAQRHRSWRRPF